MELDRILHSKKHFGELEDADIEKFLEDRAFGSEHLNLEFKSQFPQKSNGKSDVREICKYVDAFSNEEGGLLVYGVSDSVKMPNVNFPDYVEGVVGHPSVEDLSQWVRERIHPIATSVAIRFFLVRGKRVAIVKIPAGVNKPYCYKELQGNGVAYFKKTPGAIVELSPDEIREFHRTHLIDQSRRILRAADMHEGTERSGAPQYSEKLKNHRKYIQPQLENIKDFGFVGIYVWPVNNVDISVSRLREFMEYNRFAFSETLRYSPAVETFQSGVSVGYFPRGLRRDVKSTCRTTLYRDGLVAFDAQVDTFMEGRRGLHTGWLTYELQRHLQLTKELFKDQDVSFVHVTLEFENVEDYGVVIDWHFSDGQYNQREPIIREVELSKVHDHNGDKRNIVMDDVRNILDEVYRVFGFSNANAPRLWDDRGQLTYVKGLENQR
jgi:hypothetical protein